MFRLFSRFYFSPDDGNGTATVIPPMDKEEVIEFLGEDDNEEEPIELEKPNKKTEADEESDDETDEETTNEDDELSELEEELNDPDEEDLELVAPVRRAEILKKYPKLFKDFPYLEKAYYREQAYTKLLPTIEDAESAVEKATVLDNFEKDISQGNLETTLKAIKEHSPKSFPKLVDNYLGMLMNVDKDSYLHVVGNITKHTIMAMAGRAQKDGNENLKNAAIILNQFVFGDSEFTPPTKLAKEDDKPDSREEELSRREQEYKQERFNSVNEDINYKVNNIYRSTIEAHIDPKNSMTEYVKRNASREAFEILEQQIESDSRFKALVDKLWEKAMSDNYSRASVDRIKDAFTSKAKTLLPSAIKTARINALKGMGNRVKADNDNNDNNSGNSNRSNRRVKLDEPRPRNSGGKVPAGMSTLEYLMSDDS